MPTTIRTSDPRELLALIPFQLGFQPVESAVLVSVRGDHGIGLIARVDLADLRPHGGGQLARALVSHLVADGARRAVVVLYTAENLQDDDDGRVGAVAVALLRDAAGHHLGEIDCWVVGPDGYYGVGCGDPACCPPGGRSLDDLQGTRVGAQMVLEGVQVARSRDDLVRISTASPAARKAARRARVRWESRFPVASPADAHRWRRDGLELWRGEVVRVVATERLPSPTGGADGVQPTVFGGRPPDVSAPTLIGRLQAALGDVLVRDAVLLTLVRDGDRVADEVVAGDASADVGRALRTIFDPAEGRRPDPSLTGPARAVLEQLVAHSPRRGHAPALTLLAVLAWWEGDGARAGLLVDRALLAAPGYRLAVLVDDALRLGMPPGWARAQA
jgi:hypothetical protein